MTEQQCPFCQIAEGKIPSKKIYEDEKFVAVLDIHPANAGHALILPKQHHFLLPQMPKEDIGQAFLVAKKISTAMLQGLGATGTNIFVANGGVAGQRAPHAIIHVIPRYKEDGAGLDASTKKLSKKEFEKLLEQIVGKKEESKKEETKELEEEKEEGKEKNSEEDNEENGATEEQSPSEPQEEDDVSLDDIANIL